MTEPKIESKTITVKKADIRSILIPLVGTAPYVQNKFSQKAKNEMREKHLQGSTAGSKRNKREPKDFEALYRGAMHIAEEGWHGIPAPAFRAASISACRVIGFKMTLAKLSIFIIGDGVDKEDGTPLVRITEGEPECVEHMVRVKSGDPDLRPRPMWRKWKCTLHVQYDADQFTAADIVNLISRVGLQVGIGEGRPDSKNSTGMGWGTFKVESQEQAVAAE